MDTPNKSMDQSQQETRQDKYFVKKELGKIYRLFSSKKYMKYKHQFPRMKETEIVSKIIKEWEQMSKEEKLGLKEIYSKKEMQDSESESGDSEFYDLKRKRTPMIKDQGNITKEVIKNEVVQGNTIKRDEVVQREDKQEQEQNREIQLQVDTKKREIERQKVPKQQDEESQESQSIFDVVIRQSKQLKEKKEEIILEKFAFQSQDHQQKQEQDQQQNQDQKSEQKQKDSNSQSGSPKYNNKSKLQKSKNIKSKKNINNFQRLKQSKTIKNKQKTIKKQKPIKKLKIPPIKKQINYSQLKNGQYLLFYKYYFKKLKQQHPKWSETQITFIIKLLWKKHTQKQKQIKTSNQNQSTNKNSKKTSTKPKRLISGKQYFIHQKLKQKLTKQQINQRWKQLPRQSRNDWKKRTFQINSNNLPNQNIQRESNIKSETTAKTQTKQRKQKTIVTFRDILLKGRVPRSFNEYIVEENKEQIFSELLPQQKRLKEMSLENKHENRMNNLQDVHYVSLQTNPFSFMMKKMDNKILLQ